MPKTYSYSNVNYGINFLRIISIIMITVLHILGEGGILKNAEPLSWNYELAYLMETASYGAANCFALISGYINYDIKFKYSRVIRLYMQVLFYTISVTTIAGILEPSYIGIKDIIKAFFPFAYMDVYWYFSAYFCMFFFIPYLNRVMENCTKRSATILIISIFLFFSVVPTITMSEFGNTERGYSALWLALLYLVGAYIKKYDLMGRISVQKKFVGYLVCVALTWLWQLNAGLLGNGLKDKSAYENFLLSYISPTIVLSSIFLLTIFSEVKFGPQFKKWIQFFAPLSFGVYLFQEEPMLRRHLLTDAFIFLLDYNPFLMVVFIIGIALGIWMVGATIDYIRKQIFIILRISAMETRIYCMFEKIIMTVALKIEGLCTRYR